MGVRASLQAVIRRYGIAAALVSLAVGFLCASSPYYLATGDCPLSWALAGKTVLYAGVFFALFILLASLSPKFFNLRDVHGCRSAGRSLQFDQKTAAAHDSDSCRTARPKRAVVRFFEEADWKRVALLSAAVMMVLWLPYLAMLYPGVVWWDTSNQMWQYLVMANGGGFSQITDHHPIFDTMLFGGALQFGEAFLGGDRRGLFLLVVIQSCITAYAFSLSCLFLRRELRLRHRWCAACFLFFGLCPLFPIWSSSIAKDTLFGAVFVLWVLGFSYLVLHKGRFLRSSHFIAFTVVTLLVCLTKKTGMYISLPALLLVALLYRKNGMLHSLVPLASGILAMLVFVPIVISVFGMTSGGKQEMLAVPLNQTARVAACHEDDVTDDEKAAIDALLGYESLGDRYDPLNADPVKGWNELGSNSEYLAWFKAYLAQGMRHPLAYADAFLALESGWFSFDSGAAFPFDSSHHKAEAEEVTSPGFFERSATGEALASAVASVYGYMSELPAVNLLTSRAFWACIIPAFFLVAVARARDKRKSFLLLVPFALSFILLMASPISSPLNIEASRYQLPFLYCGPMLFLLALYLTADRLSEEKPSRDDVNPAKQVQVIR